MDKSKKRLSEVSEFISEYSAHLMGCGVHTSRVVRNAKRIGNAFGYTVTISIFPQNIVLTVIDSEKQEHYSKVTDIPRLPINFSHNSELSALSWEAYDHHLPFAALQNKYPRRLRQPTIPPFIVRIRAGFANASFCRLFGGDWWAMGCVFFATMIGMFIKQQMTDTGINHYLIFIVSAFITSLCTSITLLFNTTAETAIATSVLYLIPGVPLINGVIDIVEGYAITGCARLIQASLLILCTATGLSFTLLLVKDNLL